jgi:hypothetical protein
MRADRCAFAPSRTDIDPGSTVVVQLWFWYLQTKKARGKLADLQTISNPGQRSQLGSLLNVRRTKSSSCRHYVHKLYAHQFLAMKGRLPDWTTYIGLHFSYTDSSHAHSLPHACRNRDVVQNLTHRLSYKMTN